MAAINVTNVVVHNNPAPFSSELQFGISFECLSDLGGEDIVWSLTYVGSAESTADDQVLDTVEVGPVQPSQAYMIEFTAPPPDVARIPAAELLGITILYLSCSYRGQEFIRVGYYVRTDYDAEELNADPPPTPMVERLVRHIAADQPRVTRFQIDWFPPQQQLPAAEPMAAMAAELPAEQQQLPATTPPAALGQHPLAERMMADVGMPMDMGAEDQTGALPSGPTPSALDPSMQPVPFPIHTP